jgi:uncharacterized membrane protein
MCKNCSNVTLPQGNTGATGPAGPAGTNGTNGLDGAALLGTKFNRPSTSALTLSEITNIPIDVSAVFAEAGDAIEYEIAFSYNYVSGTHGGAVQISLEDGINTVGMLTSPAAVGSGLQACLISGTIVRVSNSAINHNYTISQLASTQYSSPINVIGGAPKSVNYVTVTNPGTIDNTSASLKLSAKGILNAGTNNIKVEFFKVKAIKLL